MKKTIRQSDILVGNYFKQLRLNENYTQEQITNMFEVTRSAYSRYENGSRSMPFSFMRKLCALYHLDFRQTVIYLIDELEKRGLNLYE